MDLLGPSSPPQGAARPEAPNAPRDVPNTYSIIFVLGGPGAGKGTQCCLMTREYDFIHLSVGDVLREEIKRPGSIHGPTIERNMREGRVGPMEITVGLLREAIVRAKNTANTTRFLIDGKFVILAFREDE